MTNDESEGFFARIEYLEKENEWLKSITGPLDAANLELHVQVKVLKEQLAALNQPVPLSEWQKMEQQLAELRNLILEAIHEREDANKQLAECQALSADWNQYYRRKHHPRCGLLEAAGTDSLGNQCTCLECIQEDVSKELAECQAREKVLRDDIKLASIQYMGCGGNLLPGEIVDAMTRILNRALALPSDSTALDNLKKQWQREALLEAAEYVGRNLYDNKTYSDDFRRMAKELE